MAESSDFAASCKKSGGLIKSLTAACIKTRTFPGWFLTNWTPHIEHFWFWIQLTKSIGYETNYQCSRTKTNALGHSRLGHGRRKCITMWILEQLMWWVFSSLICTFFHPTTSTFMEVSTFCNKHHVKIRSAMVIKWKVIAVNVATYLRENLWVVKEENHVSFLRFSCSHIKIREIFMAEINGGPAFPRLKSN